MLSANPKDAMVSNIGIQNFLPNCLINNPRNKIYNGTNAHLLLKKIIMGSNEVEAHF
jgi:hypothetical protein